MNKRNQFQLLIILGIFTLFSMGCVEETESGGSYCEGAVSPYSLPDNYISQTAKDAIFAAPNWYRNVGDENVPVVVVPFEFPQVFPVNPGLTKEYIRSVYFGENNGSLNDYFRENSRGRFEMLEGYIADPVTMDFDTAFYNNGAPTGGFIDNPVLHQELMEKVGEQGLDWSIFDTNNNFLLTNTEVQVVFIPSIGGLGAARPGNFDIQPSNANSPISISMQFVFADAKRSDETTIEPIAYNFFTHAHELCHGLFGLPDRYANGTCGTGAGARYDLMSNNCESMEMNPVDKMWLGWLSPKIIGTESMRPNPGRYCYLFENDYPDRKGAAILYDENAPDQFWMIENRNRSSSMFGFDGQIPKEGLVIWNVNLDTKHVNLVGAENYDGLLTYEGYGESAEAAYADTSGGDDIPAMLLYPLPINSVTSPSFELRNVSPAGREMTCEF